MADEKGGGRALLVDDPAFDAHIPLGYHPERPERLVAARAGVGRLAGALGITLDRVEARPATDDELARVHRPEYIEALGRLVGHSGYLDPDTYVAPGSIDAARRAAGGAVALIDAMLRGSNAPGAGRDAASPAAMGDDVDTVRAGIALLRPPGHHARPSQAMGFCLLNNVAVAAAHARARGLARVAVVDWDVHHGNGTQEMFYRDPSVLYLSTHQFPFYPGTGALGETGAGDGTGFTVNVPLAAGGGDAIYRAAFERVLLPVLEAFAPELVLVSAGFDAAKRDPLAEMELSTEAFGWMARALAEQARRSAGGRIALVLEGGYDLVALEAGIAAAMKGMLRGEAAEIAVAPDAGDIARAAIAAGRSWREVR